VPFQMRWKSSILDDLEGRYSNRNCIGCSVSSLATAGLFCYACGIVWSVWQSCKHRMPLETCRLSLPGSDALGGQSPSKGTLCHVELLSINCMFF